MPPAALFWDNDGILVDTEPIYFAVTRTALARLGVDLSLEIYQQLSLREGRSCFDLALERGVSPEEIERSREVRNAHYIARLEEGVDPIHAVEETLERVHGRFPMAVVTSSYKEPFALVHARSGLLRFFDFVLASGDYARHKPHPEPYLAAAARAGVDPGDCWAVEDTERGVQSAVAAGMRCIAIPTELSRRGDFSAADSVLGSIADLPALLRD